MRAFYERNNFQSTSSRHCSRAREITPISRRDDENASSRYSRNANLEGSLRSAVRDHFESLHALIICKRRLQRERGFSRDTNIFLQSTTREICGTGGILTSGQVKNCSSALMNRCQVEDAKQRKKKSSLKKEKNGYREDRLLKNLQY